MSNVGCKITQTEGFLFGEYWKCCIRTHLLAWHNKIDSIIIDFSMYWAAQPQYILVHKC